MSEQAPDSHSKAKPVDEAGNGHVDGNNEHTSLDQEMEELRHLLLGHEGKQIEGLQERLNLVAKFEEDGQVAAMGRELPKAIRYHNKDNTSLANSLGPTVEKTLHDSISRNPQPFVDAIFPAIGPAIRRSITEALRSVMESMNRIMEHSLSVQSIKWRIEAARTGRPFSEIVLSHNLNYRVEQLFLIEKKSGLLIQHLFADSVAVQDSDIVSSMLNAIQAFVRDSLGAPREDVLESIEIGDLTVLIEPGPDAILAAVVRGIPTPELRTTMKEIIEAIHLQFGHLLDDFDGDTEPLVSVLPLMRAGLIEKYKEKEKNNTRLWILAGIVAIGLCAWFMISFRNYMLWAEYLENLRNEPGIVVTQTSWEEGRYVVEGLKDPMATHPDSLLPAALSADKVEGIWDAYMALDSLMVVKRVARQLGAPQGVSFRLENDILYASGIAPGNWISTARDKASLLFGFSAYDDQGVIAGVENQQLISASAEIESIALDFEQASAVLDQSQGLRLDRLRVLIRSLESVNRQESRHYQIQILGYASTEGNEEANRILSEARALTVRDALIARGVPENMISANGTGNPLIPGVESTEAERAVNRRVSFRVLEN